MGNIQLMEEAARQTIEMLNRHSDELQQQLVAMMKERDDLKQQVQAARERVTQLEEALAWVSLYVKNLNPFAVTITGSSVGAEAAWENKIALIKNHIQEALKETL